MDCDFNESAVLLGLAEVKVPFKNLTPEERIRIVHICYRKLLEIEDPDDDSREKRLKCIGVVDSFYALQEVHFTIDKSLCRLYRKEEVILQHSLSDVIITVSTIDFPSRVIIVSQTQSFGKTALVLQMQSANTAQILIQRLSTSRKTPVDVRLLKANGRTRRAADSLGRTVGKKVNDFLSNFSSNDKTSESTLVPPEECTSLENSGQSDDDDELNSDSETEDDADTGDAPEHFILNAPLEPRPSFDKSSMSPVEAEIEYLIQSESSFVCALKRLLDYRETLYNASEVIKKKHTDQMMMYIEELHAFHKKLLKDLKGCRNDITSLLSVFSKHSDTFRFHVLYISNIPVAEKIFSAYEDTFKQTNQTLSEDLRKPRMRLNHYILTFEGLKKNCPEESSSSILEIIELFKAYLKEADTRLVTDSVGLCPFNLMDYGFLTLNGELSLKRGAGFAKRRYHVLLLNKILVLAKGTQESCEYVASFYLASAILVHELRGVMIHIRVKHKQKSILLIFKAKTIKLQQKWIEKLKNNIKEAKGSEQQDWVRNSINEESIASKQPPSQVCTPEEAESKCTPAVREIGPPLSVPIAYPKRSSQCMPNNFKSNLYLYVRKIQDSERLLLKNLERIISQKNFEAELRGHWEDVKNFYEFHLRYFYSAITYTKDRFDFHLCEQIVTKKKEFVDYTSRLIFLAVTLKYECKHQLLMSVFRVLVDNFYKYRLYFSCLEFDNNRKETIKSIIEVRDAFEEIILTTNSFLKQKYVPHFPYKDFVLIEGFLTIKKFPEEAEEDLYVVLTLNNTHFLSFTKNKSWDHFQFNNKRAKMGHPTSINSFSISFRDGEKSKRKFTFIANDIEVKNNWISCFNDVLPEDMRRKELIRTSGIRRRVNFEDEACQKGATSGSIQSLAKESLGLSIPVTRKVSDTSFIESDF